GGDPLAAAAPRRSAVRTGPGFRPIVARANPLAPPPSRGENPAAATYADARSLSHVFATAQSDLPLFSPADQVLLQQLQSDVSAVAVAGPDAFGPAQVGTLLSAAAQGINVLTRLPC